MARTDQAMVQAAMTGHHQAVVGLLTNVQPDVRRFARARCRTSSDVDDAEQEALWLLYRRIAMLGAAGWRLSLKFDFYSSFVDGRLTLL